MNVCRNLIAVAVFSLACFPPSALAQSSNPAPRPDQMTLWRARRWMAPATVNDETIAWNTIPWRNKVSEPRTLDLKSVGKLAADCGYHGWGKGKYFNCKIRTSDGKEVDRRTPLGEFTASRSAWSYVLASEGNEVQRARFMAEGFVSAMNTLSDNARHPEAARRNFRKIAAEWRALATKPAMPEEVRVHRLVAEDEVKQKHPSLALYQYEAALEVFPTWPEGFFNAALIAAELGLYAQAAEHMQSYLELVPEAPDAQTARDQIAVWKYKAKNQ